MMPAGGPSVAQVREDILEQDLYGVFSPYAETREAFMASEPGYPTVVKNEISKFEGRNGMYVACMLFCYALSAFVDLIVHVPNATGVEPQ